LDLHALLAPHRALPVLTLQQNACLVALIMLRNSSMAINALVLALKEPPLTLNFLLAKVVKVVVIFVTLSTNHIVLNAEMGFLYT